MADVNRGRVRSASPFFAADYGPRPSEAVDVAAESPLLAEAPPTSKPATPETPALPETPVLGEALHATEQLPATTVDGEDPAEAAIESPVPAEAPETPEPATPDPVEALHETKPRPATSVDGEDPEPPTESPVASETLRTADVESPAGPATTTDPGMVPGWPSVGPYKYGSAINDARHKVNLLLSQALLGMLTESRVTWGLAHQEWMLRNGGQLPGTSAWREGLARLGLKYIDDPDLFRAIPLDQRRRRRPEVEVPVADGLPAMPAGLGVDWQTTSSTPGVKENALIPTVLSDEMAKARIEWGFAHPEFLQVRGSMPGMSAFFEGLCRVGLKHAADAELDELIPFDARRRN